MISRLITDKLLNDVTRGKVIALFGPRQVGKTTLLHQIEGRENGKILTLNCDDDDDRLLLQKRSSTELRSLISDYTMVTIDEVQRVDNVGLTLKKIGDLHLSTKVIVTGSSSLGIKDKTQESATGRLIDYNLFPFSLQELAEATSWREEARLLETRMIYGLYPEVVTYPADARRTLANLTESYLYKDILSYGGIRKPEVLQRLVKALAFQVGSEVSYNEIAKLVGIDRSTVENYIDLLEKSFVIFRLESFSRNMRNEIKKGKKIYFYDNGVRNAVISNFAPLDNRTDTGALWENLMISERLKSNKYSGYYANRYFWRTRGQQEIDYIEEIDGKLNAFEFKWNSRTKAKEPASFKENYPDTTFTLITPDNYRQFVSAKIG